MTELSGLTPSQFFKNYEIKYNFLQMQYEAQADLINELSKRLMYIEKQLNITYRTIERK